MESRGRCLEDRRHTNREVDRSELNSNKSHNHKSDQRTIQEHCATYKRVELQVDVGEGRLLEEGRQRTLEPVVVEISDRCDDIARLGVRYHSCMASLNRSAASTSNKRSCHVQTREHRSFESHGRDGAREIVEGKHSGSRAMQERERENVSIEREEGVLFDPWRAYRVFKLGRFPNEGGMVEYSVLLLMSLRRRCKLEKRLGVADPSES